MPTLLGSLTRATNLLRHQFDDHVFELGIGTTEYLVMRVAFLNPDASAAQIRRSLGILDPAFSDVIARAAYRGYLVESPHPNDRRTRRIGLTLPGRSVLRIADGIQGDLAANAGTGAWMTDALARLDLIAHRLSKVPPAEIHVDGLPVATA